MAKRCTCVGLALTTTNLNLFLCNLVSVVSKGRANNARQTKVVDIKCFSFCEHKSCFPVGKWQHAFQPQPWLPGNKTLDFVEDVSTWFTEVVNTVLVPGCDKKWRKWGHRGHWLYRLGGALRIVPRGWCMTCMEDNDVEWDGNVIDEVLVAANFIIEPLVTLTSIDYLCL